MKSLLDELVAALSCLPSVGEKSAQRIALHLLERDKKGGLHLASTLKQAIDNIKHCDQCRNFTENALCSICSNPQRSNAQLCIVETPADLMALEASGSYQGRYFVLMGRLSPLEGVGPDDIGLQELKQRIEEDAEVKELIFALGSSLESEATLQYILEQVPTQNLKISRIAYGVPMGGGLEYVDKGTLSHALSNRNTLNSI